jgi:hypothetical protein
MTPEPLLVVDRRRAARADQIKTCTKTLPPVAASSMCGNQQKIVIGNGPTTAPTCYLDERR